MHPRARCAALTAGMLVALAAPASAQLAIAPESLAVEVPQRQTAERTVTVTNTGSETVRFCLFFDRPLQRVARGIRLSPEAHGGACGEIGEVLLRIDQEDLGGRAWTPYGLIQTPSGRLFVAENGGIEETFELTPNLEPVRTFEHPTIDELDPFPATTGLTYNSDTGTLWWLNIEGSVFEVYRALLLEGDLNGVPTGRRIELPVADSGPPPAKTGLPVAPAYDPAAKRYYFIDTVNQTLWAVDTLGNTIPGYPVPQTAYPDIGFGFGLHAHGGSVGGPEGVRLELPVSLPGESQFSRVLVLNPEGEAVGPETPLPDVSDGTLAGVKYGYVRSTLDPNGLAYVVFANFNTDGVLGIRPHPLPPSWLGLEMWEHTLASGESVEVPLIFQAEGRAVGTYTATLQMIAETGAVVEVPLTLNVLEATATAPDAEPPGAPTLTVYPNPARSEATVRVTLGRAAEVRLAVYDLLGRRVATLHDGVLAAGTYDLAFARAGLPNGLYLVRLGTRTHAETRPLVWLD